MSIKKLFEERVGVLSVISWPWEIHVADWLAVCISDECMRLNSHEEGLTKDVVELLNCGLLFMKSVSCKELKASVPL